MRTKRSLLNLLTGVLPYMILSFIGLFKMKYFIQFLGDETLGLYQFFSQIMIYIALVDGGLTSAVLYALYKPNSEKDEKKLYSILLGARKTFNKIGLSIFGISLAISLLVPLFIEKNQFDNSYISFTFMLFALSNIINYFFIPSQVILEVKERKYIYNIVEQTGMILQGITEIIVLILGCSFITVLLTHILFKLAISLIIFVISNKLYKNPYKDLKPNYCFSNQIKHLLVHKVNGLVGSNIDILIISSFFGLSTVAVYSTYNFIYNAIRIIISKISSAVTAIIGNYKHKNEKLEEFFMEFNNLMFYVAIVICVPLALSITEFIEIWYEGDIKSNYLLGISFSLLLMTAVIKIPTTVFVSTHGLFKETKIAAICDSLINLTLSFSLIHILGIEGVVFATVISVTISEYFLKNRIVFKKVFNKSNLNYQLFNIKYFALFAIDLFLGLLITSYIDINNILIWTLFYVFYTLINALIVFVVFYMFKTHGFINRYINMIKRGK